MVEIGVHIVPLMSSRTVVEVVKQAERIGYDYCLIADEGFHPDVYACLGAAAEQTSRIRLGAATNGYTRHPAVTAAAMATVNELSGGRAFVTLLAGGSMVLAPMGIPRDRPYRVVRDTVETLRALWTGDTTSWSGSRYSLDQATLGLGHQSIPIWIASRGPLLLGLAGREADGALITVRPDLGSAFDMVDAAAAATGVNPPKRIYLGRICYTPEMLTEQALTLPFVLMDSPERTLVALGLSEQDVAAVRRAAAANAPEMLRPLISLDLLARYQISGTPAECSEELAKVVDQHRIDAFFADVLLEDLDDNIDLMEQTYDIVRSSELTTHRSRQGGRR